MILPTEFDIPRVLFVDDDVNMLNAMRRMLRPVPGKMQFESNPKRALELIPTLKPHVIFSDFHMPEMTGVELLKRALALYPPSVRILASGLLDARDIERKLESEIVHEFITKPWDNAEFIALITRCSSRGVSQGISQSKSGP